MTPLWTFLIATWVGFSAILILIWLLSVLENWMDR